MYILSIFNIHAFLLPFLWVPVNNIMLKQLYDLIHHCYPELYSYKKKNIYKYISCKIKKSMGNNISDFSIFRYSTNTWHETSDPTTLQCIQNSTLASFILIKQLNLLDTKSFILRTLNRHCLVDVLAIITHNQLSSKSYLRTSIPINQHVNGYTILIQKIPYRIPDLGMLSYHDGIYILKQGLKALKILNTMFSNYYIEEQFIGVNYDGQCKFWINQNYFKCQKGSSIGVQTFTKQQYIKPQFIQQSPILSQNCRWTQLFKSIPQYQNINIYKPFIHLLKQIQIRMIQNMNDNQKKNYNQIKYQYLGNNIHINKQKYICKIQQFIKILSNNQKIYDNYRIKLPYDKFNINKLSHRISLKKNKSQTKFNLPTFRNLNKKQLSKVQTDHHSKVSLKTNTKTKINVNQWRLTAPTSITKSIVKCQTNSKDLGSQGSIFQKFEENDQSRIWQLIE